MLSKLFMDSVAQVEHVKIGFLTQTPICFIRPRKEENKKNCAFGSKRGFC